MTDEKLNINTNLELTKEEIAAIHAEVEKELAKEAKDKAKKELKDSLKNERNDFLILDWYKDQQTRAIVKAEIEKVLDELLPRSYDPETYKEKCTIVYQYLYDIAERGRHWA